MAIKAVNDSFGPDDIESVLAVNGDLPRLGLLRDRPSPSTNQTVIAVEKENQALTKYCTPRQVRDALCERNGLNVNNILSAPNGSHTLVNWMMQNSWEKPFTIPT